MSELNKMSVHALLERLEEQRAYSADLVGQLTRCAEIQSELQQSLHSCELQLKQCNQDRAELQRAVDQQGAALRGGCKVNQERKAFEEWANDSKLFKNVEQFEDGYDVQAAWVSWQARAEKANGMVAELLKALRACAYFLAGHDMSKNALINALELARAAIQKADPTSEQPKEPKA